MNLLVLDCETFYEDKAPVEGEKPYSLKNLSIAEYVKHPKFKLLGFGLATEKASTYQHGDVLLRTPAFRARLEDSTIICHNAHFDIPILAWLYGIRPKGIICTLSMARAMGHRMQVGGSLEKLCLHYGIGQKPPLRPDSSPEEVELRGHWDAWATWKLFKILAVDFPRSEYPLIDLTIRQFIDSPILVDVPKAMEASAKIKAARAAALAKVGATEKDLGSTPKLVEIFESLGVDVPMKPSPNVPDKWIPAFAKTDDGMQELLNHEDETVQAIAEARIAVKGVGDDSRADTFVRLATYGPLPIFYKYWGTHPGRWSGGDGTNLANLRRGGVLRDCLIAPPGHVLIEADMKQIQARLTAWLAGQQDMLDAFASGRDLYCEFGTDLYGRTITKADEFERFTSKFWVLGCFAANTKVLTHQGWKPIISVLPTDLLWDGEEWVSHQGLCYRGEKITESWSGVEATPEHMVLTGDSWQEWRVVRTNPSLSASALALASSKLPLGHNTDVPTGVQAGNPACAVTAAGKDGGTGTIYSKALRRAATLAGLQSRCAQPRNITVMPTCAPTTSCASILSTVLAQLSLVAITRQTQAFNTMEAAGFVYTKLGETAAKPFSHIWSVCRGTQTPKTTWTESTTTRDTPPATFALYDVAPTCRTEEKSGISRRKCSVYDLLCAGPRNRFTILTADGPLIVHNSGFGMGAAKGAKQMRAEINKRGLPYTPVTEEEAKQHIGIYRRRFDRIPELWDRFEWFAAEPGRTLGPLTMGQNKMILPNGTAVHYANLRQEHYKGFDGRQQYGWRYNGMEGRVSIWGGKFTQNCIGEGTEVLTDMGWLPIEKVTVAHRVWDGLEWVNHSGIVFNGIRETIEVAGVRMTPDHRVLTTQGWRDGIQAHGFDRAEVRHPHSVGACADANERRASPVARTLSVRCRALCAHIRRQVDEGLSAMRGIPRQPYSRHVETSRFPCMGFDATALQQPQACGLAQLWGARNQGLPSLGTVREFLGRHGRSLFARHGSGPNQQRQGVQPVELSVGVSESQFPQQTQHEVYRHALGAYDDPRGCGAFGATRRMYPPTGSQRSPSAILVRSIRRSQQVYDILNCGPRQRFVVRGSGSPLIVHNCALALERALLAHFMLKLKPYWQIVMHTYDSLCLCVKESQVDSAKSAMTEVMTKQLPAWAAGLPVGIDIGVGRSYGECGDK